MTQQRTVKVKICGITCVEDALVASDLGADAIGFVFAKSPRQVSEEQVAEIMAHLDPLMLTVGVFVDAPIEVVLKAKQKLGLDVLQLHGSEDEEYAKAIPGRVIKAVSSDEPKAFKMYANAVLLIDSAKNGKTCGGTGRTFDWTRVVELAQKRRLIIAGGLNPDNVEDAVRLVRPYAVDVSSGVEKKPGRKDSHAIEKFIKRAKSVR